MNSIDGMMNNFSNKLKDIEYRVTMIENRLNEHNRVPSGSKGPVSTIGNNSPSPFSNFAGTASKNNKHENNFSTPPPNENLSLRI